MRRLVALAAGLVVLASACGGGGESSGVRRLVQVDYRNDEFGSHFWRFFPRSIDAHPGDTVDFHQTWTGEPHTVTLGTIVDRAISSGNLEGLPRFDPYRDASARNASEPCYLATGKPPTDPDLACAQKPKPAFTGRYAYYSSGFLPPAGARGSDFKMKIAPNVRPGTYRFYCVIHFPVMQGSLVVRPSSQGIASASAIAKRARSEIAAASAPLEAAFKKATSGVRTAGVELAAGIEAGKDYSAAVDSFVPLRISTHVGQAVKWTVVGAHTISFGVPASVPVFIRSGGTLRRNPVVDKAAGGSPDPPAPDFTKGPLEIDGGTYGGDGLYSSGLLGSEPFSTYTLRFAKAGTYRYACLVHPPMVGAVVVSP